MQVSQALEKLLVAALDRLNTQARDFFIVLDVYLLCSSIFNLL